MKRKLIIILVVILIVFLGYNLIKYTSSKEDVIDETITYNTPVVALITTSTEKATIKAGMYRYGDIDQNGIINENDIKFMELLLNSKLSFKEEQILLADMDKDGQVTDNDLKLLKEYISQNNQVKYDTYSDSLLYCISEVDDNSNCKWQKSNEFKLTNKTHYYVFAKLDKISKSYELYYEIRNDDEKSIVEDTIEYGEE